MLDNLCNLIKLVFDVCVESIDFQNCVLNFANNGLRRLYLMSFFIVNVD